MLRSLLVLALSDEVPVPGDHDVSLVGVPVVIQLLPDITPAINVIEDEFQVPMNATRLSSLLADNAKEPPVTGKLLLVEAMVITPSEASVSVELKSLVIRTSVPAGTSINDDKLPVALIT